MIARDIIPNQMYLHGRMLEFVHPRDRVLDVGAGLGLYHKLLKLRGAHLTTLDAYEPYVALNKRFADVAIVGTAQERLPQLLENSRVGVLGEYAFDVALAIDFVEHLEKKDAVHVLDLMAKLAPRAVVFTPHGFHPQDKDNYGMGGDYWQTHRSAWQPEDLEALGFTVESWTNFHHEHNCSALFAWR